MDESADVPEVALAGFVPASRVNGPGRRVVVWVQGCDLACPGCFNPGTHAGAGERVTAGALADRVVAAGVEADGVTFSGGEPFQQAAALAAVAEGIRQRWPEVSLMAFSGYRLEELRSPDAPPGAGSLLRALDLLVDGRYDARRRVHRPWRASGNQRLWVLGRPPEPELLDATDLEARAELHVDASGGVLLSGFPDAGLRRAVQRLTTPSRAGARGRPGPDRR